MLPSPSPPLFNVTHLAREIFTILSFKRHTHCSRFWCCFFSRINKCSQLSNDSRHRSDTLGVWIIVRKFFFGFEKKRCEKYCQWMIVIRLSLAFEGKNPEIISNSQLDAQCNSIDAQNIPKWQRPWMQLEKLKKHNAKTKSERKMFV